MEDEVDVDIEGDEFENSVSELDGRGLVQEQFIQSAWKSSAGILPWELDSSISAENREVIERMLLEEQYYLTGEEVHNHIWESDANSKTKAKKSPAKTSASGSSSRWSKQEKELFEEGLAQFGRRWTKIAKLVGSRTVLQVKSYARQYFKHKAKSEPRAAAPSAGPVLHLQAPQPTSSRASTLSNTVRIEKLSDEEDEEVDITDDLSDDGDGDGDDKLQTVLKTEFCEPELQAGAEVQTDDPTEEQKEAGLTETKDRPLHTASSLSPQSPQPSSSLPSLEKTGVTELDEKGNERVSPPLKDPQAQAQTESKQITDENEGQSSQHESSAQTGQLEENWSDGTDSADKTEQSPADRQEEDQEDEDEDEDEDEEELKAPEQEIEMDMETITEDEKQAIPEFFEGRPSKTPERYLKIRNYILDQWLRSKPKYLNKTSVRPGLKNCGDVNCIGRIHTYLELIGAINFNCEQAVYNRPKVVDRSKHKVGKDVLEAYQLAQRLQSMRTRKRRVRDIWGNWRDAKDLEGQTYEHLSAEELALRREEMKKHPKPCKMSRFKGSFDPFQLIPCRSFGEDVQEPFQVIVCAETLLIMDMHAHVSRGEVIGLLGGTFNEEEAVLKICAAEPCNSVSTGLQCEMDPLSQTQACDVLSSLGFSVVGWYHSHPSFNPNPSVRDINTQDQFQSYFSRGGAPFIGMIVSPYDPANRSPHSQTTCLLVKESQEPSGPQKLPYRFDFLSSQDIPDWEQTLRRAQWIIQKYCQTPGSVQMDRFFRKDSHLTCLEKMLSSLARYLEPLPDEEGDPFLTQIQALFQSDFIAKQQLSDQEEGESLNTSSRLLDSDDLVCDQLISEEMHEERGRDSDPDSGRASDRRVQRATRTTDTTSETNTSTVLHLGSVLSTEHDYLL
ncbi:histone H2A deubiquitinase MYSM1 [Morone saxatilis]|uniref:histone H2A deubiquitinase MYSM1 n=1 Tax=Morone saxatilis TaxID=34816 RepID=UPI0015E25236|nr:histone H2A deubiquitinase MYSM1 [Morone saxatilis]